MFAMDALKAGIHGMTAPPIDAAGNVEKPPRNFSWGFSFRRPLRYLWLGTKTRLEPAIAADDAVLAEKDEILDENWVSKVLRFNSLRKASGNCVEEGENCYVENEECDVCVIDDEFDRESFSKLLRKVSLAESRLYAQLSYLGSLAYCIPQIKPGNLLRYHGLQFVTSSLEKKELLWKVEKEKESAEAEDHTAASCSDSHGHGVVQVEDMMNGDMASMTAVVAAEEEVKQAVADDLNSSLSSPCDWFICDDHHTATRFFVIQGSESLASWKANLLFEPVQFEGLDVLVHRGIYEAAKGIYEHMLPSIHSHLQTHKDGAKFRFTGHSLGGSLSVLLNLMLLIRGGAPPSSLLPVITYGAPSIMCGGDRLLQNLGLPRNHVRSITMHRDIVPRAFSCNYPDHVAEFLKAVNGNFRNHPCLDKQKLLYTPMGELLILQPDETFSPNHDLLPPGTGLYLLASLDIAEAEKKVRAAQAVFLNSPHPLEILSDRSAYGSEGSIQRDHDMLSYLKSVRNVIRHELNQVRKARREERRRVWWPVVAPMSRPVRPIGQGRFDFSGVVRTGRESLKRFSTLVASQHMHLLVVLMLGNYGSINIG